MEDYYLIVRHSFDILGNSVSFLASFYSGFPKFTDLEDWALHFPNLPHAEAALNLILSTFHRKKKYEIIKVSYSSISVSGDVSEND